MTKILILFSAITFFAGCDSGSGSQDADSGTTIPGTDSGTSITANGDENPCLSKPECAPVRLNDEFGWIIPCGWDKAANICYASRWCEPSVASSNPNNYNYLVDKSLRPESAVCPAGILSYVYPAKGLLMWGEGNFGSQYTTKIQNSKDMVQAYGTTMDVTAFVCKLYPDAGIAISC
jgi:hypothetical protein